MKTKIYIADINSTITEKFNNATILYPKAQKDNTKPNCLSTIITEGSEYIIIATTDDKSIKCFKTWDEAAEYANTLESGTYNIGIRPAKKMYYTTAATIKF